jgi:hypothetical protein
MASSTWKPRHEGRYTAIPAPISNVLDTDELAEDGVDSGLDPQYSDLPCYVPLIDDDGLDPFAFSVPSDNRD